MAFLKTIRAWMLSHVRKIYKHRILLLFLMPGLVVMIINCYMPMIGLIMAFKKVNYTLGIIQSPFVGFDNFRFLFATSDIINITRNTILFNVIFIFGGLVLCVFTAIVLNEIHSRRASKLFQTVYMMPYFMSMVVVAYALYAFLAPSYGFFNATLFPALGLEPIQWYMKPEYWFFILPLVLFWVRTGGGSVYYIASITGIDGQLFEAACVDGATRFQQIRFITLPLLRTTMIILTVLNLGNIIRSDFGLFYQVTMNSAALYSVTDVLDTFVYRSLSTGANLGMVTAASLYQSAVGFACVLLTNFIIRKVDPDSALF